MECMDSKALKSSFYSQIPATTNNCNDPQINNFNDENLWCSNGAEDFSIDEFFDIPNEDDTDYFCPQNAAYLEEEDEDEEKYSSSNLSLSSHDPVDADSFSISIPPHFSPADLIIPVDDLQYLELWSNLMDDSVPEPTFACPNPIDTVQINDLNRFEPDKKPNRSRGSFIPSAVPVKPRSKRTRKIGWLAGSHPKPDSSSSSSTTSSTSPPLSPVSTLIFPIPVQKKHKKTPVFINGGDMYGPPVQRRCTHCQVTKTPQWRAGPNGPKSLCNACGVRFKSGRLFPEYRPACSPTFSSEVHSNSHRKVLEMRQKKEIFSSISGSISRVVSN